MRRLCTKQLLQLCKAAGDHVAPHAATLVPALLETLSVVEDQALNYLQVKPHFARNRLSPRVTTSSRPSPSSKTRR